MQSWIHVIEWRANVRPELTALADDRGAAYTYAQLRAGTERRAGGWAGLGVGSGDVVAVVAKNSAEAVLARHPAVADVAVLGRPDPAWGEAMHAVIIPAADQAVPATEIIAWCRDRLAHFKCPKSVEFTDTLPRTTTGKMLKRELRAQLSGQRVRS